MFENEHDLKRPDVIEHLSKSAESTFRKLKTILILDSMAGDDGLLLVDESGKIEFTNESARRLIGRNREEVSDVLFASLIAEAGFDNAQFILERLSADDIEHGSTPIPSSRSSSRGETQYFELYMAAMKSEEGRKTLIRVRDVTQRANVENTLRKTNKFFSNIIKSSVDGILGGDMRGIVLIFNEGAEQLLNYRADEVIGKMHISQLYEDPVEAWDIMRKIRSDDFGGRGKLATTQVHLQSKQGEIIPCNLSAATIYEDENEVATVGIFSDLRERIRMERELEETHLQLVQSEKMASLGKLAAGVAHEINNPLGGILMLANMLLEEVEKDDPRRGDLEQIVEQTLRCKDIVRNLLDFSRQYGKEKTRFSLNERFHKVVTLFGKQPLFKHIDIRMEQDSDLPLAEGDPGLIDQVITNLIVNAADAMDGCGVLTLRTRIADGGDFIIAEVEDTGCGIPEQNLSRIFDPFFTTKKVGQGTGLGLSTAYGIVQKHGGRLTVHSEEKKGSVFRLELPVPFKETDQETLP